MLNEEEDLQISQMSWKDIWQFAKIRNHLDRETDNLAAFPEERKEKGLKVFARMIINRRLKILILKNKKEIIGYVSLIFAKFKKFKGNVYLTIAIRKSHRGKGLGTKLMKAAEDFCSKKGIRRIELEVFSKNPAIKLYKKIGYKEEGRRIKAVENNDGFDDVVIMAKFLDNGVK